MLLLLLLSLVLGSAHHCRTSRAAALWKREPAYLIAAARFLSKSLSPGRPAGRLTPSRRYQSEARCACGQFGLKKKRKRSTKGVEWGGAGEGVFDDSNPLASSPRGDKSINHFPRASAISAERDTLNGDDCGDSEANPPNTHTHARTPQAD